MDAVSHIELHAEALDGVPYRVLAVRARESLLETYEVEIDLLLEEPPVLRDLLGNRASVELTTTEERRRAWHGIVWSARATARPEHDVHLRVVVVPRVRRLELGRDTRVFRDQSVPAVIDVVLRRAGLPEDAWSWQLVETLPVHDDIVQYAESDLSFCLRLLAEEGIAFAIQNGDTDERVLFFDSPRALERTRQVDTLRHGPVAVRSLDAIFDVRERHVSTSRGTALRDHDLRRPDRPPHVSAGGDTAREVYLHPGGFHRERDGERRAQRYLEALRRERRTLLARSDAPWLEPGRRFHVEGHERMDVNDEHAVVSVSHSCVQGEAEVGPYAFENELVAIPAPTPYRPHPMAGRPRAIGLQTAFVTVPAGLEHHSDELGRFKVRFPWDRSGITDAESSTWCRVGQLQLPGPMVLPRVGFEVDVTCEQGDWDRHLVTAHRYNAEQLTPYPLPASAATSSWQSRTLYGGPGSNEVRFDDTSGVEELFVHASMHLRELVLHDAVRRVTNDERVMVGIHQALTVTADFVAVVGGHRTVAVGRNSALRIEESYSDGVGQDERVTCGRRRLVTGGDLAENVRLDRTSTVGPLHVVGAFGDYAHRTLGDSATRVGALWAEIVAGDRVSRVRGSRTESVAALKYVEAGTFRVHAQGSVQMSFSELEMEAGGDRSEAADGLARLAAGGALHATATHVSVTASSNLTLCAGSCTITLASSGTVTLHAPRVNLRNAESIGSQVRVN